MKSRGPVATRVVALGDLFREVVPVLLQAVAGVQVGVLSTICDGGKVTYAEVNTCCLVAGRVRRLDFVFTDEVEFPSLLLLVVDGANLL